MDKPVPGNRLTGVEFQKAPNQMRNNKALGPDGIPIEMIKNGGHTLRNQVEGVVKEAYRTGNLPKDFVISEFVAIPKKSGTTKCEELLL